MFKVYGMSSSGNCYKVRLLLEQLRTPYQWVELDTRSGVTRSQEFLAKNPNGRVPMLELEPGQYLAESDAILFYLAEGTVFWPQHRRARAAGGPCTPQRAAAPARARPAMAASSCSGIRQSSRGWPA